LPKDINAVNSISGVYFVGFLPSGKTFSPLP